VFYCGECALSGGVGGVVVWCGGGVKSLLLDAVQLSFEVSKFVFTLLFQLYLVLSSYRMSRFRTLSTDEKI